MSNLRDEVDDGQLLRKAGSREQASCHTVGPDNAHADRLTTVKLS